MPKKKNRKLDNNQEVEKIKKSDYRMGDYLMREIFYLLLEQSQKQDRNQNFNTF